MQIDDNYLSFKDEIILLDNEYLTGTIKSLDADSKVIVAKENDILLGYIYYTLVLDEAEIVSICVKKEARRSGVATKMLDYLMNKQINFCYLEVKDKNQGALNLYLKYGFKEYLRRKNYYSDNSDAILMKWGR